MSRQLEHVAIVGAVRHAFRMPVTSVWPEVPERIIGKLLAARRTGEWSWTRVDADVTDTIDEVAEERDVDYSVSPYTVARVVAAIDDALPADMRFTVSTSTDRMLAGDARGPHPPK